MKRTNGGSSLISKDTLLSEARLLLAKENFTHEDNARCGQLMSLADRLGNGGASTGDPELRSFEAAIRRLGPDDKFIDWQPAERRDMSEGGSGINLVPQLFRQKLQEAMKAYDAVFDPDVTTHFETERGGPCVLPMIDDTSNSAAIVGEGVQQTISVDPTASQILLPKAPTWRSGMVKVSIELLQDAAFSPSDFLARAFANRFARAVGPVLTTSLLGSAKLGRTASGDLNSGGTGANSVGYQDLLALRTSVNPAYRASEKVWWLMNDNTLAALDNLLDKQGQPILDSDDLDSNGNRLLFGFPIGVCPSLPGIGTGAKPILFGATDYFVLRVVPQVRVTVATETFAEFGQVLFFAFWRGNGALTCADGADSPVKYLQNT